MLIMFGKISKSYKPNYEGVKLGDPEGVNIPAPHV